jgi:glycine/D-amino acid oxidase-like deaminating enzyme
VTKRVIIVGAGIIGAAIAYHLARAGALVTVVDGGEPGGLATRASFAWINASSGNPQFYFRFRMRSMAEWRRLDKEVARIGIRWCGGLLWDLPRNALEAFAREHASWGYGIRSIDSAEALRLEPNLAEPPEFAVHVAEEGVVEPLKAARALLAAAEAHGALIRGHVHVKRLFATGGSVVGVETEEGRIEADHVVLAAGAGVPPLAAGVGVKVPLTTPAGLLIYAMPSPKLLNGLVLAPELHLRQTADGRIVAGADFGGAAPGLKPEETAPALFARVQAFIKGGDRLVFDSHTVGYRPMPSDEIPIIGWAPGVPGLYIAAMHSGITNAPAVGLFAAREILEGERDPLLAPFGIERFAAA